MPASAENSVTRPWIMQSKFSSEESRYVGIIENIEFMMSNSVRTYTSLKGNICNDGNLLYMTIIKLQPIMLTTDTNTTVIYTKLLGFIYI